MKKKNITKKKTLLIALPIVLLAIIIVVAISVNKSNNERCRDKFPGTVMGPGEGIASYGS